MTEETVRLDTWTRLYDLHHPGLEDLIDRMPLGVILDVKAGNLAVYGPNCGLTKDRRSLRISAQRQTQRRRDPYDVLVPLSQIDQVRWVR